MLFNSHHFVNNLVLRAFICVVSSPISTSSLSIGKGLLVVEFPVSQEKV
jgi:hypothetical protein